MESNDGYIKAEHVSRSFQTPNGNLNVLGDISFQIKRGEFICIVGGSGCGKALSCGYCRDLTASMRER